ncbi:2',3'-cyclic-nucleotide 2'-phosphodiesterase (5'-nucleotidase family) [Salsuginibacillus halophilus]|uniref:2',3'-cyclic-nucleotide 2'-phosphodiesterase (5'-nucleotidase family) n=1 Tax=Salsuginibacillus halophilus TaxID=517424 RepID=A0A2P8HDY4_9BACI|nr:bifunctional UDP-sugar hydrolase/5'-nucleotidase [Salsuginibacillus halophilus]PSL44437.1 2',3'-cyclic-nucleotide 2'-phosphodiesterase (5'-nucleotidase family) [Salsuginibacillus halophilus]
MKEKTLTIYHLNDLHSNLTQWPAIVSYLKKEQARHAERSTSALYVDIGDHADKVHPLTEGTKGTANTKLLNASPIHHATIGNNEGITFSRADLNKLYDDAAFTIVLANLFTLEGERPAWAVPYDVVELEDGFKIGITGLTAPFYPMYDKLGWQVEDPEVSLAEILPELKAQSDLVVVLSHLGYPKDEKLAASFEGLDLILGAHTHHLFKEAVEVNGTTIGQAGKHGYYIGQMQITYDPKTKALQHKEGWAVSLHQHETDEDTAELMTCIETEAERALNQPLIELAKPLQIDWNQSSPFGRELAEAVRSWCGTDIAMVNAGLLLDHLDAGTVTAGDLHEICPHPVNPCTLTVTGAVLKETLQAACTSRMINLEVQGFGFRGHKLGFMETAGLDYTLKTREDGSYHIKDIKIHDAPLNAKAEYRLATVDMFTFGYLYPGLAQAAAKEYFMPEMLRDVLAAHLQELSSLNG